MHILVILVFPKNRFCIANWPIFSEHHRSTTKQNFHLKKLSDLLDRNFYVCAYFWNYSTITGAAGAVQKSPKFVWEISGESVGGGKVLGIFVIVTRDRASRFY